jgi:hypothetical protein
LAPRCHAKRPRCALAIVEPTVERRTHRCAAYAATCCRLL